MLIQGNDIFKSLAWFGGVPDRLKVIGDTLFVIFCFRDIIRKHTMSSLLCGTNIKNGKIKEELKLSIKKEKIRLTSAYSSTPYNFRFIYTCDYCL